MKLDQDNKYVFDHYIKGDTIDDVLSFLEYSKKELTEMLRKNMENGVHDGSLSVKDTTDFLALFQSELNGYTYLGG